ncbi:hypothetical protein L1887_09905 [Cichorium endivia]|nr:hypothetical protein L1887_09905 [Cichorium endivia]
MNLHVPMSYGYMSQIEMTHNGVKAKKEEKVKLSGIPAGPMVALAFKPDEIQFGQLTYLRIYEGVLKKGDIITSINTRKKIKVSKLVRMHSDSMEGKNEYTNVGLDEVSED